MRRFSLRWIPRLLTIGIFGIGVGVGLQMTGLPRFEAEAKADPPPATAKQPSARRTIVVDVAQGISPAVVSIGATRTTYIRETDPFGYDLYFPLYKYAKRDFPYLGSGFILDKEGHVLTNYHVVQNSTSINVTLPDRRSFSARLIDADTYVDVALLKIEGLNGEVLPTIKMGDSRDIMIGETVIAVGNPFGPLISDPRPSVSVGVVSAVDRSFKLTHDGNDERTYRNMIQTDAAINPGNSGGPLVNLDGEVIGINTFIFSSSGESASVGFSIPINRAAKVVEEILEHGKVRAIWLDIEPLDVTPSVKQWLSLTVEKGALVKSIEIGGPAEKAGIAPGDVIVEVDGFPVNDSEDLLAHIMSRNVGDTVKLKLVRQDRTMEAVYPMSEAPRRRNVAPTL